MSYIENEEIIKFKLPICLLIQTSPMTTIMTSIKRNQVFLKQAKLLEKLNNFKPSNELAKMIEDSVHKILELYGPDNEEQSPSDSETDSTSFRLPDRLEIEYLLL